MDAAVETVDRKSCPWAETLVNPSSCSLTAVMDEELAKKLQEEEENAAEVTKEPILDATLYPGTDDDLLLAQFLQMEFDAEHDRHLTAHERHMNGNSKVSISLRNYRQMHPGLDEEDEDSDEEWAEPTKEVRKTTGTPSRGGSRHARRRLKAGTPTKHDPVICGRRNVQKVASLFPPEFPTGDVTNEADDFQFSNQVYTALKKYSAKEQKQSQRIHEKKEHSTQSMSLDPNTRLLLFKFVDSGTLDSINGCIATGKEASVYHAFGGKGEEGQAVAIPPECALKVFKTTLNEFKCRDKYIRDDHRFRIPLGRQNPRKIVKIWAEKESRNLQRLAKANVRCPSVVLHRKHVLVMEFIGEDQKPARQIRSSELGEEEARGAYVQCIDMMKRMYEDAKLVHADLSEFNMLWFKGQVYFIDVSQAVEPSHTNAFDFLYKDCVNVVKFFRSLGVEKVMSAAELFGYVCGVDMKDGQEEELLSELKAFNKKDAFRSEERKMFSEDLGASNY
eukprot:m.7601 g.7601  ORF g.7601 m.7601 type:complete len:504 (+) comp19162_c0_seq1:98-1609(+)